MTVTRGDAYTSALYRAGFRRNGAAGTSGYLCPFGVSLPR